MKRFLFIFTLFSATCVGQTYTANARMEDAQWYQYIDNSPEWTCFVYADLYLNGSLLPPSDQYTYTWYSNQEGSWHQVWGSPGPSWVNPDGEAGHRYQCKVMISGPGFSKTSEPVLLGVDGTPQTVNITTSVQTGSGVGTDVFYHWASPHWLQRQNSGFLRLTTEDYSRLRIDPSYVSSGSQRFNYWNSTADVFNHAQEYIYPSVTLLTAHFTTTINGVVLKAAMSGYTVDSIDFRDPWLADYLENPYGVRNQGVNAPFKRYASPFTPSSGVGVFQNQSLSYGAFYSIRAPAVKTISGSTAFFCGWSTSGVNLTDNGEDNCGYFTADVVFLSPGATVTANYSNTTISSSIIIPAGTYTTAGALTVNSGVTLAVSSGATVKFPPNTSLTVNGALNATGATFTSTSIGGVWNGITLNANNSSLTGCTISSALNGVGFTSGITGTVNECTLQNCTCGVIVQGNSAPNLTSNTFNGNYDGVYVLFNGSGSPSIYANSLAGNVVGIMCYNSTALIRYNSITSNNTGINCVYSSPTSGAVGQRGGNSIRGNSYGIVASRYSYPCMGNGNPYRQQFWGVCNDIEGNSVYDAEAVISSGIAANFDYWGPGSPKMYYSGDSYVDNTYKNSDPSYCPLGGDNSPIMLSMTGGPGSKNDTSSWMQLAKESSMDGDYSTATTLYIQVLNEKKLAKSHAEALSRLYNVFLATKDSTILEFFSNFNSSNKGLSREAQQLLALSYSAAGRLSDAAKVAMDLKTRFPDTLAQEDALMILVSLRGFDRSYSAVSKAAFTELAQKYGSSIDRALLVALRAPDDIQVPNDQGGGASMASPADSSAASFTSYPNPFNPSTQIRFTVKVAGFVTLRIYDVLGREVASLVNDVKIPGTYSVNWNANQLATGIYFARFESAGKVQIRKMLYLK